MFGSEKLKKVTATTQLAGMLVAAVIVLAPSTASAQGFGEMLFSPGQGGGVYGGEPQRSLRNPLIPGAPNAGVGQMPYQGQPPAVGDGSIPAPVIGGDLGAPSMVPSGLADPTHGNFFPTRSGQGQKGPQNYVPGAGRIGTQNGHQQGMFDFGEGQMNGMGMGPGGKNNGTGWINNGGAAGDATGMGPGGKNGGTAIMNNGGSADDARGMGPGGRSDGTSWVNNGGAAADATGMGPGGKNGGTAIMNNGGAADDARGMGGGGKNGGTGVVNNGGSAGNATGIVNNGGPRSDAAGSGDRLFAHTKQPNRYDFSGPLPTVRTFSRYLVILGVVVATVFVSLAAWSMVFGNPYGGSRVIGAVGGLLLLLAGYTIWKIVQMNTFHANSTGWEAHYRDGTPMSLSQKGGAPVQTPFAPPQNPNAGGGGGGNNPAAGGGGPFAGGGNPAAGGGGNPPPVGGGPNPGGGNPPPVGGGPNPGGGNPGGGNTGGGNNGGGGFIPILGGG